MTLREYLQKNPDLPVKVGTVLGHGFLWVGTAKVLLEEVDSVSDALLGKLNSAVNTASKRLHQAWDAPNNWSYHKTSHAKFCDGGTPRSLGYYKTMKDYGNTIKARSETMSKAILAVREFVPLPERSVVMLKQGVDGIVVLVDGKETGDFWLVKEGEEDGMD